MGGTLGSIIRIYLFKTLALTIFGIPFQLLAINVLGSFIMGILTQLASLYWLESENIKYFLMSGLLGGFTTFSSFALDFGSLIEQEKYMPAIFYVMLSVGLSLSCFFLGIKITKL